MTNQINKALRRKWALQGTKNEHLIPTAFRVITNRTYWNNQGKFQAQYDYIYNNLMPDYGSSTNEHIEAIRCVSKIYHEYYNNGNSNTYDSRDMGDETGDYYVYEIREHYKEMVRTIESYLDIPWSAYDEDSKLCNIIKPFEINHCRRIGEYLEGLIDQILKKALPQITLI
jgi:hypothetical protein